MTKPELIRDILKGEHRRRNTDYEAIEARILTKLKKLPSFDLDWVECMINHLIARTQQPPEPPMVAIKSMNEPVKAIKPYDLYHMDKRAAEPPRMDDPPDPANATHLLGTSTLGHTEGFKGLFSHLCEANKKTPIPLETNIETICFSGLIKLADKFGVSHNESQWTDDEWIDREDELRVLVAETMEKVGK